MSWNESWGIQHQEAKKTRKRKGKQANLAEEEAVRWQRVRREEQEKEKKRSDDRSERQIAELAAN